MSLLFSSSSSLRRCIGPTSPLRSLVSARFNSDGPRRSPLSPEKTQILRDWAEEFQTKELDKELPGVDVRFDRSGGAGGQVSRASFRGKEGRRRLELTFFVSFFSFRSSELRTSTRSVLFINSIHRDRILIIDTPFCQVNTKATVRISLAQASPSWIPSPLLPTLTSSSVRSPALSLLSLLD